MRRAPGWLAVFTDGLQPLLRSGGASASAACGNSACACPGSDPKARMPRPLIHQGSPRGLYEAHGRSRYAAAAGVGVCDPPCRPYRYRERSAGRPRAGGGCPGPGERGRVHGRPHAAHPGHAHGRCVPRVGEADARGWVRSRTLLASSKGLADSGSGSSPESLYARLCPDADDCLSLVGGTGLPFSAEGPDAHGLVLRA